MLRAKLLRSLLAVVILPLSLAGCPGFDALNPNTYAGTYKLQSVNGKLPYVAYEYGNSKLVLERGSWTIGEDNSLRTMMAGYKILNGRAPEDWTEVHDGTVSISGSTVTVRLDNGRTGTAELDGNRLLVDDNGNTLRFSK